MQMQELEQEKYHLRRRLEVAEEEYELKVSELHSDITVSLFWITPESSENELNLPELHSYITVRSQITLLWSINGMITMNS